MSLLRRRGEKILLFPRLDHNVGGDGDRGCAVDSARYNGDERFGAASGGAG